MSKGKTNGKDAPNVVDMLGAVNAKMNQGMSREAEFVKARTLAWNPQEDITPIEVARALMVLMVGFSGGDAFAVLEKQAPEVQRHFEEPTHGEPPVNAPA